jgi:hypothetical protein
MFTTPFAFMAAGSTGPTPSWTPADFTNLWDWWTASTGVNTSGGYVDSWDGYNGNSLVPFNGAFKATYSASDANFDNQPSVRINPTFAGTDCGYYTPLDGIALDGTVLMVARMNTKYISDYTCLWANSMSSDRYTMFTEGGGDRYLYYNSQASPQSGLNGSNCTNGEYMFLRGDYNYTTGDTNFYQSNTNTFTNLIGSLNPTVGHNYNIANLTLGSYYGIYGTTSDFTVVEFIKIDGIPTSTEISNFETYLANKYGF